VGVNVLLLQLLVVPLLVPTSLAKPFLKRLLLLTTKSACGVVRFRLVVARRPVQWVSMEKAQRQEVLPVPDPALNLVPLRRLEKMRNVNASVLLWAPS
jgi:hypothetical protein